jgi:hypothetical protein
MLHRVLESFIPYFFKNSFYFQGQISGETSTNYEVFLGTQILQKLAVIFEVYRMGQNKIENFRRIVDDFQRRLDACIEAGGKQFA